MARWQLTLACALVAACSGHGPRADHAQGAPLPPVARRIPHDVVSPHGTRVDPYYWLRDDTRSRPEVLSYLRAEDAYAAAMLAPAQPVEDALVRETRARIADEATTAPSLEDGYWYYARYRRGEQYPVHVRRKGTLTAPEEIVLDESALARGHSFYAVGDQAVSRDGRYLAWTDDTVGRNQFTLHVKNLVTGEVLPDSATAIAPTVEWANDSTTLFYVGKDPRTLREDRVMRHPLGGRDSLIYQEPDAAYYVDVRHTKSRAYLLVDLDATTESETRLVDLNAPTSAPRVFLPRTADRVYALDHVGGRFVMRTNDGGENFRVVEVPGDAPTDRARWRDLVPHRDDVIVESFVAYESFVAAGVRMGGLARIDVVPRSGARFTIAGDEPAFTTTLLDTADPAAVSVRYRYESLTTPPLVYEQDVITGARREVHREPAPTHDPTRYRSEYVQVTTDDGAHVPVSLVYRADTPRDGTAPLLVTGYGAYGECEDPTFERTRISLLDRGWVFAIAHVRGGEELGHAWYEAGRQLAKKNTFDDFIAVTEYLVRERYAARDRVFAEGGSAGGLLIAAIANMRPDLYRGLVAWVPFVDVLTTMLDPSIPLVTNEYEEWGDPADKAAYDYMLSYSPYDNVRAVSYPALYVRTGLHDSQVQYYEPAKWVAKLRATKTDDHLLVFETDWNAGHAGKSGRFDAVQEQARAYAFMLYVLGGGGAR